MNMQAQRNKVAGPGRDGSPRPATENEAVVYVPIPEIESLIPRPSDEDRQRLYDSIKANGMQTPIDYVAVGGKRLVLDGYTRLGVVGQLRKEKHKNAYLRAREVKVVPKDYARYALDANLARRHLTSQQRIALLAGVLEDRRKSGRTTISREEQKEIAKQTKTSTKTVGRINKLLKEKPEVVKQVAEGKKSLRSAVEKTVGPSASSSPRTDLMEMRVLSREIYDLAPMGPIKEKAKRLCLLLTRVRVGPAPAWKEAK